MTTNADVTIAEVIEVARRKQALLTPETAGYLVLEAAYQLVASPVLVDEHLCSMQVDGGRISMLSRRIAHPLDAERGLRQLLRRLLEVSSGRAPALSNVAALPPKGDLAALLAELESALIPVNRGAASRALSRLARETIRARRPSVTPGETAPAPELEADVAEVPSAEPSPADDTEPMEVPRDVSAREPSLDEMRDSQETLNRHVTSLEPSLPRFPLDSAEEPAGRASDAHGFTDEATTARRIIIAEPRAVQDSSENVQDLLDDCMPPSPPPPAEIEPRAVLPAPTPPPAAARAVTPEPAAVVAPTPAPPAALPPVGTPRPPVAAAAPSTSPAEPPPTTHEAKREPVFSSYPPSSARGVDELLQDFLSRTSRKQDRVAHDLRKMAGVDPPEGKETSTDGGVEMGEESPFPNAGGATDFYTSTPPPRAAASPDLSHEGPRVQSGKRRGVYAILALIIVAASSGVALLRFEPGFLSGRTPSVVAEEQRAAAEAASALAAHPPQACRATLIVTDVPVGAEVLVRAGLAPVDVEHVPSGARLEFVALADGYAPRRGIIPQGTSWDLPNGRPRFELPIQLEKSRAKSGAPDPWPAAEPGSVVGGQGAPGTVHVVTSPRGAEVWMVAGGGPEAKLESLRCGTGMDLLVAGMQQAQPLRRRLHVEAARLTPEPSGSAVTHRISAGK